MPLLKKTYTSKDYWNLPDGQRAELIDGQFYNMAPPSRIHQEISYQISRFLGNYIESNGGKCRVYPAPFAVNLDADDKDWVEPDISVICDPNKLTDRGCSGAPDLIFEIVSPSSRRMDYNIKNALYAQSGIREYWIIDPVKERVTVYHYEDDAAPVIYTFTQNVPVGIYPGLTLRIADLIGQIYVLQFLLSPHDCLFGSHVAIFYLNTMRKIREGIKKWNRHLSLQICSDYL